jgi:hypothetical protein
MDLDPLSAFDRVRPHVTATLAAWAGTITIASASGLLARLAPKTLAPAIVMGIVIPTAIYGRSPLLRAAAREIGLHRIALLHTWRIAAGVMFLAYGARDKVPPTFVRRAGWGDIIAGVFALALVALPRKRITYAAFNAVGFLDFVLAVGTGLAATVRRDQRMGTIATFRSLSFHFSALVFLAQRILWRSIFCVAKERQMISSCTSGVRSSIAQAPLPEGVNRVPSRSGPELTIFEKCLSARITFRLPAYNVSAT